MYPGFNTCFNTIPNSCLTSTFTTNKLNQQFTDNITLHCSVSFNKSVLLAVLNIRRHVASSALSRDLRRHRRLGSCKIQCFETQSSCLSNKEHANHFPILMKGPTLSPKNSFRLVGFDISSDLLWHGYAEKVGFLFKYFSAINMLTLYNTQISLGLEDCSHVCSTSYTRPI